MYLLRKPKTSAVGDTNKYTVQQNVCLINYSCGIVLAEIFFLQL